MPHSDLPKAYPNLLRYGNFDAIHVGAAASFPEEVMKLLDLLKPGGVMIVPQYESEFQSGSQVIETSTKGVDWTVTPTLTNFQTVWTLISS